MDNNESQLKRIDLFSSSSHQLGGLMSIIDHRVVWTDPDGNIYILSMRY